MYLQFPAAMLALAYVALLCGLPALALRMLIVRFRRAKPGMRLLYLLLCVIATVFLLFNLLHSAGMTGLLQALTPPLVADNAGTVALLFAWLSAGLCVLLALIVPPRRSASQI